MFDVNTPEVMRAELNGRYLMPPAKAPGAEYSGVWQIKRRNEAKESHSTIVK